MSSPDLRAKSSVDCFAWQYAFYTHLLYRKAPGTAPQLLDITRVVHLMRGHRDPIRVAHETLLTWPFDTTEWGGQRLGPPRQLRGAWTRTRSPGPVSPSLRPKARQRRHADRMKAPRPIQRPRRC